MSKSKSRTSASAKQGASRAAPERPLSVAELSHRITRLLEKGIGRVAVEGEISNLRVPRSGHAYFVLKDEGAALNAVCFRSTLARLAVALADGKKVEVHGRVTAYSARSEYQIIVESAREAGLGELMRRFLELRDRLKAEGVFDPARKRPLPALPRKIGVVTSATGAALRDVLNVLARRASGLEVFISPCAVQGAAAPGEIVQAIRRLERHDQSEVIIIARGGGSIEDLWSFNDERVVRAIAACKIPTVAGVGHETDTTLADFAADVRAPTPSAAAEIVTAHYREFIRKLSEMRELLIRAVIRQFRGKRAALEACANSWGMRRPIERLGAAVQKIDELVPRLERAATSLLSRSRDRMRQTAQRLDRASPGRRLDLARSRLAHLQGRLAAARPDVRWGPRLRLARSTRDQLGRRLDQAAGRRLGERRLAFAALKGRLLSLGPESVLRRGFSIITAKGGRRIITGPGQARVGETLRVQSAGGPWRATPLPDEEELFDGVS